ncbi:hypothetical protein RCL1_004931 [Eukaryota sp. TZLM3-RCL]
MDSEKPPSLSDYKKIKRIARGAQGKTLLVLDKTGTRLCAKIIYDASTDTSPEAQVLLKKLDSPFLVPLYDCFPEDEDLILIMEYLCGGSLHDFLLKERPSNTDIWVITTQLVYGLNYLHERAIVHRDLKPGNVLLCSTERPLKVKICDFGICRDLNVCSAKSMIGTVHFMSPEVILQQRYDFCVDMWALGVLIYYLVHGNYPFNHFGDTLNSEIPQSNSEFGPLISSLLVRDVSKRATAKQLTQHFKIREIYDLLFKDPCIDEVLPLRQLTWTLNQELSQYKQRVDEFQVKCDALEDKVGQQEAEVLELRTTGAKQNEQISAQLLEITSLQSHISDLQSTVTELEVRNSEFLARLTHQDSELLEFKSLIATQIKKMNQLEAQNLDQEARFFDQISVINAQHAKILDQNLQILDQASLITQLQSHSTQLESNILLQNLVIDDLQSKFPSSRPLLLENIITTNSQLSSIHSNNSQSVYQEVVTPVLKESKVLMICPEFTPNIAGGLGVASEQIVRTLAPHVKLSLVVPGKEATTTPYLQQVTELICVPLVLSHSPYETISPYVNGGLEDLTTCVSKFNRDCVLVNQTSYHDVIHCHDWLSIEAGIELKKKTGAKLVFHVHSLEVDRNPTQRFNNIFEIESKGFQAADKIIVVSDFTRSKLLSCYPHAEPSKIHVVHNGTDVSSFEIIPTNIPGFTKPSNKKVILFLGRLAEMKGLNYFIKIANELEKNRPGAFFFLVVGDGDHKNWAINQVKQLNLQDSFHFTGMLERQLAMAAFKLADVFLMTSINEPFGLVALEAVLMNCPVVLSSMSGVLEVLPSALSAHHTDVSSWVKHIEFLVDNPLLCEKYLTGLQECVSKYTWDRSCQSLLNVYGSLLN